MRLVTLPLTSGLNFAAGAAGGIAFYAIWRRLMPRARSRAFWQALPVHVSGLLRTADPDETLRHYGALMKHTASFAVLNTIAVIAGLVPVVALYLLSRPAGTSLGSALAELDHVDFAFLAGLVAGSVAAAVWAARAARAPA